MIFFYGQRHKKIKIQHNLSIIFLVIIWVIKFFEIELNLDFSSLGIYPLKAKGLIGILTAPLIHSNLNHLISNSAPFFILGVALLYFYPKIVHKVFIFIYLRYPSKKVCFDIEKFPTI